ncbi:class I SAM-dependent methyltransferase [Desulfovibrio litoralis]|uniref:Methyltransferase domain-containing protein n=1 Tax=Desulfovibrio litoralis DSM 11393 TaxID=1121455 RepID=A0A1M7RZ78_9BACT|nr:class I SAM-dependent methyltransferase [Desulfovibrio litoralis]SHN51456.1 Methyltransferase domain-containing protein [Desulfovibrio litoralis DSM 11393]
MQNKDIINAQNQHWNTSYTKNNEMFGETPSEPAVFVANLFKEQQKTNLLELGAGQGRDTLFFGNKGFKISALDYSQIGLTTIKNKAQAQNLSNISLFRHDIRKALPFKDATFDVCYAHMLFCMALTTTELIFLMGEIKRVLKPKGLCVYTARTTDDPHYKTGIHRGENMYEVGGFIVHFFNQEMINQLSTGFELVDLTAFQEGTLPRQLFRVTLKKI